MSKALDELMGKHRNVAEPEAQQRKMHFDDEEVCKHELAGLCPYTLFNNTKSDLGMPLSFLCAADVIPTCLGTLVVCLGSLLQHIAYVCVGLLQ